MIFFLSFDWQITKFKLKRLNFMLIKLTEKTLSSFQWSFWTIIFLVIEPSILLHIYIYIYIYICVCVCVCVCVCFLSSLVIICYCRPLNVRCLTVWMSEVTGTLGPNRIYLCQRETKRITKCRNISFETIKWRRTKQQKKQKTDYTRKHLRYNLIFSS